MSTSDSTIKQRAKRAVGWTAAGSLSWRVLSSATSIAMARILGPSSLGEYGFVRSTAATVGAFVGLRLGNTSSRYVAKYHKTDSTKTGAVIILVLSVSFLLFSIVFLSALVFISWGEGFNIGGKDISYLLVIGIALMLITMFGSVLQNTIKGFENYQGPAKINFFKGLITPIIVIPCAYFYGVKGALWGFLIVALLVVVPLAKTLNSERIRHDIPIRLTIKEVLKERPLLWHFALPGVLISLSFALTEWFGRYIVINQEGGSLSLGVFVAAEQWRVFVELFPMIIAMAFFPIISNSHGKSGNDFHESVTLMLRVGALAAMVPALICVFLSDILVFIYGNDYRNVDQIILALIPAFYLRVLNQFLSQIYSSMGRRWPNAVLYLIYSAWFITLALKLIPKHGLLGLALTIVTSELVLLVLQAGVIETKLYKGLLGASLSVATIFLIFVTFLCFAKAMVVFPSWLLAMIAMSLVVLLVYLNSNLMHSYRSLKKTKR